MQRLLTADELSDQLGIPKTDGLGIGAGAPHPRCRARPKLSLRSAGSRILAGVRWYIGRAQAGPRARRRPVNPGELVKLAALKLFGDRLMPVAISVQGGCRVMMISPTGPGRDTTRLDVPIGLGLEATFPLFPLKPWVAQPSHGVARMPAAPARKPERCCVQR